MAESSCLQKESKICNRLLGAMASDSRAGKRLLIKSALFLHPLAEGARIMKAALPQAHGALELFSEIRATPDMVRTRDCCGGMEAVHSPCLEMKMSAIGKDGEGKWVALDMHPESVGVFSLERWKDGVRLHISVIERAFSEGIKANPELLKLTRCAKFAIAEAAIGLGGAAALGWKLASSPHILQGASAFMQLGVAAVAGLYGAASVFSYIRKTKVKRTVEEFGKFISGLKTETEKFFAKQEAGRKEYF